MSFMISVQTNHISKMNFVSFRRGDVTDATFSNTDSTLKTNTKYKIEAPLQMEAFQKAT